MPEQTVTVGEREYAIRPFRGYKALRVGHIVAAISRQVPDVLEAVATFTRQYEASNAVRITRLQALTIEQFRDATADVSDAVWEQAGGILELPSSPSMPEQVAAVFPLVFENAEPQVVRLLALIATSDTDLRDADEEGEDEAVDALLKKTSKRLLHEGTIDELLSLAIVATEVIREQFAGRAGEVGKLKAMFGMSTPEPTAPKTKKAPSKTRKAPASTDSQPPTDGPGAKPSTGTGGDS